MTNGDVTACAACLAGNHGKCSRWTKCACALGSHRVKLKKPRRWGRKNEPEKK